MTATISTFNDSAQQSGHSFAPSTKVRTLLLLNSTGTIIGSTQTVSPLQSVGCNYQHRYKAKCCPWSSIHCLIKVGDWRTTGRRRAGSIKLAYVGVRGSELQATGVHADVIVKLMSSTCRLVSPRIR